MARAQSTAHTIDDRIGEQRARLKASLEATSDAGEQLRLERQLRQLDTAAHINEWPSSPSLATPR
jgi:hypothetical protein